MPLQPVLVELAELLAQQQPAVQSPAQVALEQGRAQATRVWQLTLQPKSTGDALVSCKMSSCIGPLGLRPNSGSICTWRLPVTVSERQRPPTAARMCTAVTSRRQFEIAFSGGRAGAVADGGASVLLLEISDLDSKGPIHCLTMAPARFVSIWRGCSIL